jgi:hypothetical protein
VKHAGGFRSSETSIGLGLNSRRKELENLLIDAESILQGFPDVFEAQVGNATRIAIKRGERCDTPAGGFAANAGSKRAA